MNTYIYVQICSLNIYIYTNMFLGSHDIATYMCIDVHMHVYMCLYKYIYVYIYSYVQIYIGIYK